MKKIKKIVTSIALFFMTMGTKVFGNDFLVPMNPSVQPDYGVRVPPEINSGTIAGAILDILSIISFPVIFIMGVHMYEKKKKGKKIGKGNIITIVIAIIIIISWMLKNYFFE